MALTRLIFILFVFGCITISNTIKAQNLHVDNSYEGEIEDGSKEHPYKTIQAASQNAENGTIIHVKPGTYRENVIIYKDNVSYIAQGQDEVIINGTEAVLEWEHVTGELYRAIVPWNVTEGGQQNQVFVDGEMIEISRWPDNNSLEKLINPEVAIASSAEQSSNFSVILNDWKFNEPSERWRNSKIFINTARAGRDGYGVTTTATYTSQYNDFIKVLSPNTFDELIVGEKNFGLGAGTRYFLFDPKPDGVYLTGGPDALLSRGEWWKNSDTLYIKMPDGGQPASNLDKKNLVEIKKRCYAFSPAEDGIGKKNITIRGFKLFAASVLTDNDYWNRVVVAEDISNWIIDSLIVDYVFHTMDLTGRWQGQWTGKSGFIISGKNHTVKNCIFQYSSSSAISGLGIGHKILNNQFYDINYYAAEIGVINGSTIAEMYDPEIANNFIYNTAQKAIGIGDIRSSNPSVKGKVRMHHNIILNYMLRSHDGGAFNASAGRSWEWMRIDHNIIGNSPRTLTQGIYLDFGGNAIIDHNVIFNVYTPVGLNRFPEEEGGVIGEIYAYNNTSFSTNLGRSGLSAHHRNPSGEGLKIKNNIVSHSFKGELKLADMKTNITIDNSSYYYAVFEDPDNANFQIKKDAISIIDRGTNLGLYNDSVVNMIPDIGAYEFGRNPWIAGPEGVITNIKVYPSDTSIQVGDTIHFRTKVYTNVIFETDTITDLDWYCQSGGRFIAPGVFVADSATELKIIAHNKFRVRCFANVIINSSTSANTKSTDENKENPIQVNIFPNPANNEVTVTIKSEIGNKTEAEMVFSGIENKSLLKQRVVIHPGINQWKLDISRFKPGMYNISISNMDILINNKVIIIK